MWLQLLMSTLSKPDLKRSPKKLFALQQTLLRRITRFLFPLILTITPKYYYGATSLHVMETFCMEEGRVKKIWGL